MSETVWAMFNDVDVDRCWSTLSLLEARHPPVHYLHPGDVSSDLLVPEA